MTNMHTTAPDANARARVLVVHDDASLSEMLVIVLRQEGFDSRMVSRGDLALAAFREYRPDVVLLDVIMKDMDIVLPAGAHLLLTLQDRLTVTAK